MNSIISHNNYADKLLKKNSKIFYKIDWITFMINKISLKEISELFNLGMSEDYNYLIRQFYYATTNYGPQHRLQYNGLLIDINYSEVAYKLKYYEDDVSEYDYFNHQFDIVRVDVQGNGLDYLRSKNVDIEDLARNKLTDNGFTYHITRCDFAYDLINYKENFIHVVRSLCKAYESATGRISVGDNDMLKKNATRKWRSVEGCQDIIYIGTGDEMLRIYDKKLEQEEKHKFSSECPYMVDGKLPESWIRIEIETKRGHAKRLLESPTYCTEFVLKYIAKQYAIRAGDRNCKVSDVWIDLYDWREIAYIIQNAKQVQILDVLTRAELNVRRNLKSIIVLCANYGYDYLVNLIHEELARLQSEPTAQRRWDSILSGVYENTGELPEHMKYINGYYTLTA